jgi:type IV pilus assembly protein PilQ
MNKQTWALEAEGTGGGLKRLLERVLRGASLGMALSLLVASLPQAAQAQNSIQSVTGSVQGGSEVIRIELAEPLTAIPTGFSIQAPARIALDFPGISNAMGRSTVDMNVGNLRSANVIQAGERTRVVLNLKAPASYKADIQGKSLLIMLDSSSAP